MTLNHRPSELIKTLSKQFADYTHSGVEMAPKAVVSLIGNLKTIAEAAQELEAVAENAFAERRAEALAVAQIARDRKVVMFPTRAARPAPQSSPDGGDAA